MPQEDNFIPNTDYKNPVGENYPVGVNGRLNFSKISGSLSLPNLVEIQTDSYKQFLEKSVDDVLREAFPISSYNKDMVVEYAGHHFEEPRFTPLECKMGDQTYSSKLKVTLRLCFQETGEIKEAEVFMGDIPLMTESGTFIINGSERVIISQIVRSAGSYFTNEQDLKSGKQIYKGEIIPTRGTWLQLESDTRNTIHVRLDRQYKFAAHILFKAIGLDNEAEFCRLFGDYDTNEYIKATLAKELFKVVDINGRETGDERPMNAEQALIRIFGKLKPGEPSNPEGRIEFLRGHFFDAKRYDLGRPGRFKLAQKLGIYNRLTGRVLAEDLFDENGEVLFAKDHQLTSEDVQSLREARFFENGNCVERVASNDKIDDHNLVNIVKVYAHDKVGDNVVNIIGTDLSLDCRHLTISDMVAFFNYYMNLMDGIGDYDDIDHLGNRRIRSVGELLENQFRAGLAKMTKTVQQKMSTSDQATATPQSLINIRPLTSALREFFASGQLSQFMDQTNPLAELTNKRRISALGPGGLTRDRASMEVRDVHYTHYGRICPIESPEGQNIGLINNLCTYAKINEYGFIMTPYRKVYHIGDKTYVSESETTYLSADDERGLYVAEANISLSEPILRREIDPSCTTDEIVKQITDDEIVVRHDEDNLEVSASKVQYVDVSPKQIVSIAAACIPFLAHDDATRALMGANMQRQALPLLRPSIPYVGTGMEVKIAKDSGLAVIADKGGIVRYRDSSTIVIDDGRNDKTYTDLKKNCSELAFARKIKKNDTVKAGQIMIGLEGGCAQAEKSGVILINEKNRIVLDDGLENHIYTPLRKVAADLRLARYVKVGDHVLEKEVILTEDGLACQVETEGIVEEVTATSIRVIGTAYHLQKFDRSNGGTCINQTPIVEVGQQIADDTVIADGPAMRNGELALGQNILIAYMTWNGFNYEDAIIMSERMVKNDTFTSIHIEKYEIECRESKFGNEEITRDIPNVGEDAKAFLDERGIIVPGAEVKEGDILVGKATPKSAEDPGPEEKLLAAIFNERVKEKKDTSLRIPHGGAGIVHAVKVFSRKNKDPLPAGVTEVVRVYVVQKRKISEGDKMSGRHGNKGVISKILPIEDMPFLADGTPIDILLSPMGVPSRMNIGQIFEVHLGLACRKLNMRVATPAFDGVSNEEVFDLMRKAHIADDGKTVLYDGRTGEPFSERISVGVQYMIKLVHMVDDKLHARATGPYALVTQQPLGGKAQNGGQRFGEMEVWALEAYGAAHTLQEMMTIKSDDRVGRVRAYEAIIKDNPIPRSGMPEAFKVFTKELKGLCLDVKLFDRDGKTINMEELAKQSLVEERRTNSAIHKDLAPTMDVLNASVVEQQVAEEGLGPVSDRVID